MATMDGSFITMPSPRTYTRVLAVPRSMARSFENSPARILISMHPPVDRHFWELRQKRDAKCSTHGGERQENHQAFPQHARQAGTVDDRRSPRLKTSRIPAS